MQKVKCRKCKNQIMCRGLLGIELNHIRFHFLQALQVTENINLLREILNYKEFQELSNKDIQEKIEVAISYRDICYWGYDALKKEKIKAVNEY